MTVMERSMKLLEVVSVFVQVLHVLVIADQREVCFEGFVSQGPNTAKKTVVGGLAMGRSCPSLSYAMVKMMIVMERSMKSRFVDAKQVKHVLVMLLRR